MSSAPSQPVSITSNPPNPPGFVTVQFKIGTPGNPQPLPHINVPGGTFATLKSKVTNNGVIYLGADPNTANRGQTGYYDLFQGEKVPLQVDRLDVVWVDGDTSGDVLEIIVPQETRTTPGM